VTGRLNNDKLEALIKRLPGSYVNGCNQDSIMSKLTAHINSATCETKAFLLHSMTHLLRIVPEFENATDSERRRLLLHLFNQAQYRIGRNFLKFENQSIYISNIFRTKDAVCAP
jgi:hypothetical protein